MRAAVAAFVLVVALSGCGGDSTATPPAATTTPEPTTATTDGGIDPLEGASTEPVVVEEQPAETALLERVALARHEGYDRVVFEFRNAVPAYRVEYVAPPLKQDGSGDVVQVGGHAFVQVRLEPSSGYDLAADEMAYRGPTRLSGADHGTAIVREVVRVSDFEAVLVWAIGVDNRVDFRVLALESPPPRRLPNPSDYPKLVVDLRNH